MDTIESFNKNLKEMGLGDIRLIRTVSLSYDGYKELLLGFSKALKIIEEKDIEINDLKQEILKLKGE